MSVEEGVWRVETGGVLLGLGELDDFAPGYDHGLVEIDALFARDNTRSSKILDNPFAHTYGDGEIQYRSSPPLTDGNHWRPSTLFSVSKLDTCRDPRSQIPV